MSVLYVMILSYKMWVLYVMTMSCIMWALYVMVVSYIVWALCGVLYVFVCPGSCIIPILCGLYMSFPIFHHHQSPTPDKISYT